MSEKNELAYYNSEDIRENNNHADFIQICWKCSLNPKQELDKLQKTPFARGKIIIQGREVWIKNDIVKSWLSMANLEVGTEEYNNANSIISKFDTTIKQVGLPDFESDDCQIELYRLAISRIEENKKLKSQLAIVAPKAEKYDRIVLEAKEGIGVEVFYKRFAFKYFSKLSDFCKFIDEDFQWSYFPKNSTRRKPKTEAVKKGYVIDGTSQDPITGKMWPQFQILPLGEEVLRKEIEFRKRQLGAK